MKHLKLFENFKVNEGSHYYCEQNTYTFKDIIKFLEKYQDEDSVAIIGYNDKKGNFKTIPFKGIKFDKNIEYGICLFSIDSNAWKEKTKNRAEYKKEIFKSLGHDFDSMIDKMTKKKSEEIMHDFVWLDFDDKGNFTGADRYSINDVEWFTGEFDMIPEEEYEGEYDEEGDEDNDDYLFSEN